MNEGLIPHRYAKALFKTAQEKNQAKEIYGIMQNLADSFASQPELQKTVANPFVGVQQKESLLGTAAGKDGSNPLFRDFLKLLIKNRRISFIREIALSYLRQYRLENKIYLVQITSAAPLSREEIERLTSLVQKQLPEGATISLTKTVDPALIGGFSIAIDNTLLDASVKNQLNKLRSNLISQ